MNWLPAPRDENLDIHDILGLGLRFKPQIIIGIKGAYLSPDVLARLRQETPSVLINYATDDPFNPVVATRDLLSAIPEYTLYACTKRNMINDVAQAGCQQAVFVPFGYDPGYHFLGPPLTVEERSRFKNDIVFIGGADADRLPIFRMLIKTKPMDLRLYGGYWNRDFQLRRYYRGWAVGRDFRMVLHGAKIALGLVRRSNRDGHSMRTFEIPACGTFMLAERTDEHLEFLEEAKEVGYFNSNEELIEKIHYYLKHDTERQARAVSHRQSSMDFAKKNGARVAPIRLQHSQTVFTTSVTSLSGAKTCINCPQHTAMRS